jgi:hypothetical protein
MGSSRDLSRPSQAMAARRGAADDQLGERLIETPWGAIQPKVELAPLIYIVVLYGIIYFLPSGVFEFWRKGEDGPAEWLQFLALASAAFLAVRVAWRRRQVGGLAFWGWVVLAMFCALLAAEEISWGERITGLGLEAIRNVNAQEETTIHNIPAVQSLMHFAFIFFGLLFGFIGWKWLPHVDALPARRFSLYFLPVALFYTYFDLSWISHGDRIRNDQEAIELLMSIGLFAHARWMAHRTARAHRDA